jgi:hypothetical protein
MGFRPLALKLSDTPILGRFRNSDVGLNFLTPYLHIPSPPDFCPEREGILGEEDRGDGTRAEPDH